MYKYILPNGAMVDAELLADAVLQEEEYPQTYLDTDTGCLVQVPSKENLAHWIKEVGDTKHYILIERFTNAERDEIAYEFAEFPYDMSLAETAGTKRAFKKGGWRSMEEFLRKKTDGWIHAWDQCIYDEAAEYVHEWLIHIPGVPIREEFEGCGDCALCELMRRGEDRDPAKLAAAFATENTIQNMSQQMDKQRQKKKDD